MSASCAFTESGGGGGVGSGLFVLVSGPVLALQLGGVWSACVCDLFPVNGGFLPVVSSLPL